MRYMLEIRTFRAILVRAQKGNGTAEEKASVFLENTYIIDGSSHEISLGKWEPVPLGP